MDILKKRPLPGIGLEMIDFQLDNFGMKLETVITKIKQKIDSTSERDRKIISRYSEIKEIETLVYDRFNLKITIDSTGKALAAMLPFYSNKNHILISELFRGQFSIADQDKLLKTINGQRGTVDLRTARVGGIFSKYVHKTYMDFLSLFDLKITPPEVTAILLHELGHAFQMCEFSDRVSTNNQVLASISKSLQSNQEKDLEFIYKEIKKIDPNYGKAEVDELVNGNRIISGVKLFKLISSTAKFEIKTLSKNHAYDQTSGEVLADIFANRFGYGRQLISGLDKLTDKFGDIQRHKSIYILSIITDIMTIGMMSYGIIIGTPFTAFLTSLILVCLLVFEGDNFRLHTYDELRQRYIRVRNDVVHILKDSDLDQSYVKNLIEDIKNLDKLIENTADRKTLLHSISNFIIPVNGKAIDNIEEQKLIEALASNDLFVKSAELKVI